MTLKNLTKIQNSQQDMNEICHSHNYCDIQKE